MVTAIQEIHVHDKGLSYVVVVKDKDGIVDLSNASLINFHFQKPDGTTLIVPARLFTDGSDGRVVYDTESSDFDQTGIWRHQVYIEIGSDQKWSNITKFKVFPNLPLEI